MFAQTTSAAVLSTTPQTSAAVSMHAGYRTAYSRPRQAPAFDREAAEQNFDGFYYRVAVFNGVRDHSGVASTGVQVGGGSG